MNKKANVAITLLVFIALFLVGFGLFSFIIHPNIEGRVADARFVEKGFADEQIFRERMYVEGLTRIEKEFYDKTRVYPFKDMQINEFEVNELDNLRKVKVEIKADITKLSLNDSLYFLEIYDDSKKEIYLNYLYRPNPVVEINLTKVGLHSFEDIAKAVSDCKVLDGESAVGSCFNAQLPNFDSKVSGIGVARKVSFVTKKKFNIEGDLKNIEFSIPL